jgi:hypothetical protein
MKAHPMQQTHPIVWAHMWSFWGNLVRMWDDCENGCGIYLGLGPIYTYPTKINFVCDLIISCIIWMEKHVHDIKHHVRFNSAIHSDHVDGVLDLCFSITD